MRWKTRGATLIGRSAVTAMLLAGVGLAMASASRAASWTIQSTPDPVAATEGAELLGLSCSSATSCLAVGYFDNSHGGAVPFAERWDGVGWTVNVAPTPAGSIGAFFFSVSCSSTSACTAVGYSLDPALTDMTLAERWDGTSWSVQSTPTGAGDSDLEGVSCSSASACTAVGQQTNVTGGKGTLAETWNGTSWTVQSTVNPAGTSQSGLRDVSCVSASACIAVGSAGTGTHARTVAEGWDGATWRLQKTVTPNSASLSFLDGVSCASSTACMAVGSYYVGGLEQTLAERWDGISWTMLTTPNPTAGSYNELIRVSCPSASVCTAVGSYQSPTDIFTLAERWNGASWKLQRTPSPAGSLVSVLQAASCVSPTVCTAVGESFNDSTGPYRSLAERYS